MARVSLPEASTPNRRLKLTARVDARSLPLQPSPSLHASNRTMSRLALLLSVSTLTLVSPLNGQQIASEDPADLARAAIAIDLSGLAAGDPLALAAIGRAVGNARIVMLG